MNQKENNLLWVGTIVNTHGLKGEVRILSDSTEPKEIFAKGKTIYFYNDGKLRNLIIASSRPHKRFTLVIFDKLDDINDIEWVKGKKIYIEREELDKNEYYLSDLIGLEVIDQTNTVIGVVYEVTNKGPYESLEINLKNGNTTNIPMVDEFKIDFNKEKNIIEVEIPREFLN